MDFNVGHKVVDQYRRNDIDVADKKVLHNQNTEQFQHLLELENRRLDDPLSANAYTIIICVTVGVIIIMLGIIGACAFCHWNKFIDQRTFKKSKNEYDRNRMKKLQKYAKASNRDDTIQEDSSDEEADIE